MYREMELEKQDKKERKEKEEREKGERRKLSTSQIMGSEREALLNTTMYCVWNKY